jgi:hypothetical protein
VLTQEVESAIAQAKGFEHDLNQSNAATGTLSANGIRPVGTLFRVVLEPNMRTNSLGNPMGFGILIGVPVAAVQTRFWYIALDDESEEAVAMATKPLLTNHCSLSEVPKTHHVTLLHLGSDKGPEKLETDKQLKVFIAERVII